MHTLQIMDHNHKEEQKKKEYIKQRISFACSMVWRRAATSGVFHARA